MTENFHFFNNKITMIIRNIKLYDDCNIIQ